jgi:anti-sigma regulatory factor (Ser/Thr protein kinase)
MSTQLYTVTATMSSLSRLLAPLSELGEQISEMARMRAQTVLEELFANTINHGYSSIDNSTTKLVWLSLRLEGAVLHIRYEDAAPAFNPFAGLESAERETMQDVDARPVGGLGRLLALEMSDSANYARVDTQSGSRNRIDLSFSPRDR